MESRLEWARRRCAARKRANVALVSLYDIENNAVRLLAAELRQAGHHCVEVYFKDWRNNHFDPPTQDELDNLCSYLAQQDVDIVGFSIRASAYFNVSRRLTRVIHQRLNLPVFWGGLHPTLVPDQCIPHAEALCRGEADEALVEMADRLAKGEDLSDLANWWVKDEDGSVRKNPLRPLIRDLDALPFRDYTSPYKVLVMGKRLRKGDPMVARGETLYQIMASRGCIFRCAYCYNSTYQTEIYPGEKYYRTRSVSSLIAEIQQSRAAFKRMKRVRFDDEVFNFDPKWLEEFLDRYPKEVGLPFDCFLEPQLVTESKLRALKQAGLQNVFMGVQNAETVNTELYDRKSSDEHIRSLARIFHKVGVDIHYQLIFDDPVATSEDKQALFELVSSFPRPYDLYLFSMTIFPESALARRLLKLGYITPRDIEGMNTRTFYQHRVDLNYPRPAEDRFWIALMVLLSKSFVPLPLIKALSKSEKLKRNPEPLVKFAQAANFVKMGTLAARLVLKGEMTPTLVHRWLNLDSVITA